MYKHIYMCVYIHIYVYKCICVDMQLSINVYIFVCICIQVNVYTYLNVYIYIYMCFRCSFMHMTWPFRQHPLLNPTCLFLCMCAWVCTSVFVRMCAHVCVCADTVHGVSDSRTHIRTVHICISSRILPHPPRLMPCVREREREWYIYMYRRESKSARERARACIMMSLQGCIHTLLHTFVQQLIFAQNLSQNDYLSRL